MYVLIDHCLSGPAPNAWKKHWAALRCACLKKKKRENKNEFINLNQLTN